jgi:methyl-accepting chemotaxis protein
MPCVFPARELHRQSERLRETFEVLSLKSLTIDKKLFAIFSTLLLIILALLVLFVFEARRNHHAMELVLHRYNTKLAIGNSIELATAEMQGAQRGLVLSYEARDTASAPQYTALYETSGVRLEQLLDDLAPLADSPQEVQVISRVREGWTSWKPRFRELVRLCESGNTAQAYQLRSQNKVVSAVMRSAASELVLQQTKAMQTEEMEAGRAVTQANWITGIAGCLSLIVSAFVVFIVRQILANLRNSIKALESGANQIANGAGQIASSSQSLAQGTSGQAASIEETSAATEQINAMAKKNSNSARRASELMDETNKVVDEANRSLDEMQLSMNEIIAGSNQVGKIIKVIEQIAFQTNILALNAAVESARAGDAGMGFAVVADEVRTLAQRSARAAEDTALLIEESISRSRLGHSRLEVVTRAIHGITEGTRHASLLVGEMKAGSDEQAKGAQQIARAMTNIEKVTQESAAHAEEGVTTSEEMNAQAESLREVVETLHAMVG